MLLCKRFFHTAQGDSLPIGGSRPTGEARGGQQGYALLTVVLAKPKQRLPPARAVAAKKGVLSVTPL